MDMLGLMKPLDRRVAAVVVIVRTVLDNLSEMLTVRACRACTVQQHTARLFTRRNSEHGICQRCCA